MEQKFSKTLEELQNFAEGAKKESRLDLFNIDPRLIVTALDHNVRDFETEKVKLHIEELRENIRENGVMTPLECRRGEKIKTYVDEKGKEHDIYSFILIDGECRLRAVNMLIEEGVPIVAIPVILERRGSNAANRVLDMLNANIGLRFTPVELGKAYSKLIKMGYTIQNIAQQVGKSVQYVNECLNLLEFNPTVVQGLVEGKITHNNVRQIQKKLKDVDPSQRQKLVEKRLVNAIHRAKEVGEKEKAGKYIDMSNEPTDQPAVASKRGRPRKNNEVEKSDVQLFCENLIDVIESTPREELKQLIQEVIDMLEAGHPIKNTINTVFNN